MREKDLKERTYQFARQAREFLKVIPNMAGNCCVHRARSVPNYLEADNALSKKHISGLQETIKNTSQTKRRFFRLTDNDWGGILSVGREGANRCRWTDRRH